MFKRFITLACLLLAQTPTWGWESVLVDISSDDQLVYTPDADGFVLPDFSHAGYKGGAVALPQIKTVNTIAPIKGDNTLHIQTAINEIAKLPLNKEGYRGALLLERGVYPIAGTIYIPESGIVVRAEGQGASPGENTIIRAIANSPHQRDVVVVGNSQNRIWGAVKQPNTTQYIQDAVVKVGSCHITITDGSIYQIGDQIVVYHPCSSDWLAAIEYGGVPYPDPTAPNDPDERWRVNDWPITYHRYVRSIQGNVLELDAPIFYTLDTSLSHSYIYKTDMSGTVYNSGVENLRIEIESLGGVDENHAWQALRFKSTENCWATHCTFVGFGQSGIITEACRRSTFLECSALDPVAIVTGERMYNFNTYLNSELNLFQNCYARNGRHHYISNGVSGTSGNVFLNCISDRARSVNEGHRGWTQGMLYDNHKDINMSRDFTLGLYNRVAMGTGHGWAAVQSVLWNCDVGQDYGKIGLQKPPTAQNYAIGCRARIITGSPISASNFTKGYVEGHNQSGLSPASLYLAQLKARTVTTGIPAVVSGQAPRCWYDSSGHQLHFSQPIGRYKLYNIDGGLLQVAHPERQRSPAMLLPKGVYIVEIVSLDHQYYTQKLII